MTPGNPLDATIVNEILVTRRPLNVQQLVEELMTRTGATRQYTVSCLRAMVKAGDFRIRICEKRSWLTAFTARVTSAHPFIKTLLQHLKNEPLFQSLAFLLVFNAISWLIIMAFQSSPQLAIFRVIFHGINLIFSPGLAITIAWHPFPSSALDFRKLARPSEKRRRLTGDGSGRPRPLDPLTRIAYSVCYSIGLVVLIGFLIGLLGQGFDIVILMAVLTAIEWLVLVDAVIKVKKLHDPYLHL